MNSNNTRSKYDWVIDFCNGFAAVKLNNKFGFVNKKGKKITLIKYDDVWDFARGCAKVKLSGRIIFINEKGQEVEWH